jgi:SAM-dependent methyltransferase
MKFSIVATVFGLILTSRPLPAQGVHPLTGRQIAPVMGVAGAEWLVRPERLEEEQPDRAVEALRLQEGQTVADVGAGVGYFTWLLAERVGPRGTVFAVEIQPEMLRLLKEEMARRRVKNVIPTLGKVDDPGLPENALDLVLMVDVYHELAEPQKVLRKLHRALKPDGRLVLIEYKKEEPWIPIRLEHKMTELEARLEVEAEGFRFERNLRILPRQHILIFRPTRVQ